MAGVITINFKVIKDGMATLNMKSPIYVPGPVEPHFGPGRHIYFEGFSVDEHGRQHYMDVTVAYRQTILRESFHLRSCLYVMYFAPVGNRDSGLRSVDRNYVSLYLSALPERTICFLFSEQLCLRMGRTNTDQHTIFTQAASNTSHSSATPLTRSTCCSRAPPCRATWPG